MESEMSNTNALLDNTAEEAEDQEQDVDDLPDDIVELSAPGAGDDSENNVATGSAKDEEGKKKAPVWKKPDKKKKAGKKGGGGPNKQKQKPKKKAAEAGAGEQEKAQVSEREVKVAQGGHQVGALIWSIMGFWAWNVPINQPMHDLMPPTCTYLRMDT